MCRFACALRWAILPAYLAFSGRALAQQPSPIGMLYNPRVSTFAISGIGGGNLYELNSQRNSTSGQVALDWNVGLKDGVTKDYKPRQTTLTTLFKYNPFLRANFISGDSLEIRKVAFADNEFQMLLGFRLANTRQIGSDGNSKLLGVAFVDVSMAPYQLSRSADSLNTGFRNFNINGGYQIGYLTNTDFGLVGLLISPQINFIGIYENNLHGRSFEELNRTTQRLSRSLLGGGVRVSIPLNDFCFFFETRKYRPLGSRVEINGLTDRVIFSFGGIATGTVFRSKTKESASQ